jgi:hypothetical protein
MRINKMVGSALLGLVLISAGLIAPARVSASSGFAELGEHHVVYVHRRLYYRHPHYRRYYRRRVVIVGPSYWRSHRVVYVYRRPYYYRPYYYRGYYTR